jgi:hypothetical protein
MALECFARAAPLSRERAIAALSGSADSPAAVGVVGQLLGATLGPDWLPPGQLRALELGALVRLVAEDLHAVAIADVELDFRRYPPE